MNGTTETKSPVLRQPPAEFIRCRQARTQPVASESHLSFDEAAHRYYLDGVRLPNVTAVLESAKLLDYSFLGEQREFYLRAAAPCIRLRPDDDWGNLGG